MRPAPMEPAGAMANDQQRAARMTQDIPSLRVRMLVDHFLSRDLIDLLPLHLIDEDFIARGAGDLFAMIQEIDDTIPEQELHEAIVTAIMARVYYFRLFRRAQAGDSNALRLLSARLRWEPSEPTARAELSWLAKQSDWESARQEKMMAGLWHALQQIHRPQRIKLGTHLPFERDVDGNIAESVPWEHQIWFVRWWLLKQTRNCMEDELLHRSTPETNDDEPLDILLDQQWIDEIYELAARFGRAPVSKATLMLHILKRRGKTGAEASRLLGMTPEAGRIRLFRIYQDYPELKPPKKKRQM
jgi:hypothetical protein